MREIKFKAAGQRLSRERDGLGAIVAGSRSYLRAEFELDSEWDGMAIAVSFFDAFGRERAEMLDGGGCDVPDEVTGGRSFEVSLTGRSGKTVLRTNRVKIRQEVA